MIDGPNDNYKLIGWSNHDVKIGMQTASLKATGYK